LHGVGSNGVFICLLDLPSGAASSNVVVATARNGAGAFVCNTADHSEVVLQPLVGRATVVVDNWGFDGIGTIGNTEESGGPAESAKGIFSGVILAESFSSALIHIVGLKNTNQVTLLVTVRSEPSAVNGGHVAGVEGLHNEGGPVFGASRGTVFADTDGAVGALVSLLVNTGNSEVTNVVVDGTVVVLVGLFLG
jgi:hypothetical protein